jgi:hypothetical protein
LAPFHLIALEVEHLFRKTFLYGSGIHCSSLLRFSSVYYVFLARMLPFLSVLLVMLIDFHLFFRCSCDVLYLLCVLFDSSVLFCKKHNTLLLYYSSLFLQRIEFTFFVYRFIYVPIVYCCGFLIFFKMSDLSEIDYKFTVVTKTNE